VTSRNGPTGKAARRRAEPPPVTLTGERIGTNLKVTATHDGQAIHIDTVNLDVAQHRQRFIRGVVKRLAGVDTAVLEAELMKLSTTLSAQPQAKPDVGLIPSLPVKVKLTYKPDQNGRLGTLTAERDGETVHLDYGLNPVKASHRQRFIKALAEVLPNLDRSHAEGEALNIANKLTGEPVASAAPAICVELDVSRIVRPEQFFAAEVSGLTVPAMQLIDGRPAAKWALNLRWADGRRESRDLARSIDLPNNGKLWVHPVPGEPTMTTASGWSTTARQAWLRGSAARNPGDLFKDLCESIAYFIDLPPDLAAGTTATLALWSILTYSFQAWDAVPYLFIGSPTFFCWPRFAYRDIHVQQVRQGVQVFHR